MIFLLDTNAWIAYLRRSHAGLVQRVRAASPADLRLCSVVLSELYYGAYRSPPAHRAHNLGLLAGLTGMFASVPFDDRAAEAAGRVRADLAAKGTPIGPNDLLIAATALAHGLTLVTHNTAEFGRVAGLPLDDWQI